MCILKRKIVQLVRKMEKMPYKQKYHILLIITTKFLKFDSVNGVDN